MRNFFEAAMIAILAIFVTLLTFASAMGFVLFVYAVTMGLWSVLFYGLAWAANIAFGSAIPLKTAAMAGAGVGLLVRVVRLLQHREHVVRWARD